MRRSRDNLKARYRSGRSCIFASGLRNANGMAIEPTTGELWTVVNERDIGDDMPLDYLTSVKDGGFYGWPYSYWGQKVGRVCDRNVTDLIATSIVAMRWAGTRRSSALPTTKGDALPEPFRGGMLSSRVAHGPLDVQRLQSGVRAFRRWSAQGGRRSTMATGFLEDDGSGKAFGRLVGVAIDNLPEVCWSPTMAAMRSGA